jgi:DNA-binding NarL/FixJ family response regulator
MSDRRCRFGLAARIEMVRRRRAGESLRQIAAAMACSPTTVKTQIDRWNQASEAGSVR